MCKCPSACVRFKVYSPINKATKCQITLSSISGSMVIEDTRSEPKVETVTMHEQPRELTCMTEGTLPPQVIVYS